MTLKKRIKRLNENIDRFADGRKFPMYILIVLESAVYKIPSKFFFDYKLYSKNFHERRKYLSNRDGKALEARNDKNVEVLQSKYKFDEYFKEFLSRDFLYVKNSTFEEFKSFCKKHPTFMKKSNWACEGVGIEKYTIHENEDLNALYKTCTDEYVLLEEVLKQHPKMSELNPTSVNTIRVATIYHNEKVHIIATALRIGVGGVTDNLHGGGLCAAVDIETGIIKSFGYDAKGNEYIKHPSTGAIIPGFQIPNWDKLLSTVTEAAQRVPQYKWIGWDVAVTEDGAAIIEGNHNQGIDLIQIGNKGLKPDIKAILKS